MPFGKGSGSNGVGFLVPSASPFSTVADRDAWASSNPVDLIENSTIVSVTGDGWYLWSGSAWVDADPIVQGEPGEDGKLDIDNVDDGQIPVKEGNTLVSSGLQKLPNGQILAPKDFGVESASIKFADIMTVSEQSSYLGIQNNISGDSYIIVDFERNRGAPSKIPRIFRAVESEVLAVVQPDFSTEITGTSISFDYATQFSAYTNAVILKALNEMSNVRIKVTLPGSILGAKYIPDKSSWISGENGISLASGDNTVDIFGSSLALESGTTLSIELRADSVSLLGHTSGVPYMAIVKQEAVFNSLVVKGQPMGALGGDVLSVQPNTSVSASFNDSTTSEITTLNLEDGNYAGDIIEFLFANNLGSNSVVFNASSDMGFFDTNSNTFVFSAQLTLTGRSARFTFEWYGSDWRIVR